MLAVYSKKSCKKCDEVKLFLDSKNIEYVSNDITEKGSDRNFIISLGLTTVPQVFSKTGDLIGGCDETIKFYS